MPIFLAARDSQGDIYVTDGDVAFLMHTSHEMDGNDDLLKREMDSWISMANFPEHAIAAKITMHQMIKILDEDGTKTIYMKKVQTNDQDSDARYRRDR